MSQVTIIRIDGTVETHDLPHKGAQLLDWICQQIHVEVTDSVNLRDGRIMFVDDAGWECAQIDHGNQEFESKPIRPAAGKSINPEATTIYRSVCRPGTTHQIVGDVAIAADKDFA